VEDGTNLDDAFLLDSLHEITVGHANEAIHRRD